MLQVVTLQQSHGAVWWIWGSFSMPDGGVGLPVITHSQAVCCRVRSPPWCRKDTEIHSLLILWRKYWDHNMTDVYIGQLNILILTPAIMDFILNAMFILYICSCSTEALCCQVFLSQFCEHCISGMPWVNLAFHLASRTKFLNSKFQRQSWGSLGPHVHSSHCESDTSQSSFKMAQMCIRSHKLTYYNTEYNHNAINIVYFASGL